MGFKEIVLKVLFVLRHINKLIEIVKFTIQIFDNDDNKPPDKHAEN